MKSLDGKWKLVGLVSLGEEYQSMQTITKGEYINSIFVDYRYSLSNGFNTVGSI